MPEDKSGDIDFKAVICALEERMNQLAEQIKTSPSNGTNSAITDRKKGATSPAKKNLPAKEAYHGQVSPKLETGEKEIKIGAFVRNTINKLVKEDAITEDMVAMLCSKNYCKQAFDIGYPFLKQVEKGISLSEQRKINGYDRYWANEQKIHGHKYFLCNDWYERNRVHFIRWLEIDIYERIIGLGGSMMG